MSSTLKSLLESIIFVSDKPVSLKQLKDALDLDDVTPLREALEELTRESAERGVQLAEVGGGWQFRTNSDNAAAVQRFLARRPVHVSRAARETMAIIAYRQPVTRAEIDEIRGVDSSGVLKILLERNLIRTAGHKEEPGRPLLYVTSKEFLEFFHLRELKDLPTLREFAELDEETRARLERESPSSPSDAGTDTAPPGEAQSRVGPDSPDDAADAASPAE